MEQFLFILHWVHVLAAVIWIGTLYFFNFFLTPFLDNTRAEVRVEIFYKKVVIESAARMAQGGQPIPEAAACGRRVILASRTNLLLSIPTIFFMVAATHYPSMTLMTPLASPTWFWIVTLVVVAAIELNALVGTEGAAKKPLDTLSGTLWGGFILLAVFYVLLRMLG
jgi:uncharacterized membrane protein